MAKFNVKISGGGEKFFAISKLSPPPGKYLKKIGNKIAAELIITKGYMGFRARDMWAAMLGIYGL